jgi:hypothetical protein
VFSAEHFGNLFGVGAVHHNQEFFVPGNQRLHGRSASSGIAADSVDIRIAWWHWLEGAAFR